MSADDDRAAWLELERTGAADPDADPEALRVAARTVWRSLSIEAAGWYRGEAGYLLCRSDDVRLPVRASHLLAGGAVLADSIEADADSPIRTLSAGSWSATAAALHRVASPQPPPQLTI